MAEVLIIESDYAQRRSIRQALAEHGYQVTELDATADDAAALSSLALHRYRCIIAGIAPETRHPPRILALAQATPVILLSPRPDVRQAVAAIKAGAAEFLGTPCPTNELLAAVERSIAERDERDVLLDNVGLYPIIGSSPAMQALFGQVARIAPTDATVMIRGESGTGKELVARAIHSASRRAGAPMISLNCATIPPRLIEAELFGFNGAGGSSGRQRTGLFEAANGGTLFLDEIGALEPEAQARVLRVLQAGELRRFGDVESFSVDVRLITSTHRGLAQLVSSGQFREDLYYRLHVVTIDVPPLRERGDDILLVAEFMLQRISARLGREPCEFGPDARLAMLRYHWPGNVRELENAVERAAILCDCATITADMLAIDTHRSPPRDTAPTSGDQTSLEDYFVSFVLANQDQLTETELADKLGISRKSLWERRQRLNIPRRRTRQRALRRDEG